MKPAERIEPMWQAERFDLVAAAKVSFWRILAINERVTFVRHGTSALFTAYGSVAITRNSIASGSLTARAASSRRKARPICGRSCNETCMLLRTGYSPIFVSTITFLPSIDCEASTGHHELASVCTLTRSFIVAPEARRRSVSRKMSAISSIKG